MKLKRHILTATMLVGLAAGALSVRADDQDMSKMPGMKMGDQAGQTNAPAGNADAKVKPYPLKTCVVSGDKIGEMGKPVTLVYKGQEMKFCCKDCVKDFNKDPDKYIKKLAQEEAKLQKEKK
ncbi:MAG TPA: YHS domain-containing protein [Verrucomicrobiae bacterium]